MKPDPIRNLELALDGRRLSLKAGLRLTSADAPGLHCASPAGIVAEVVEHPKEPSALGLLNLSTSTWQVRTQDGRAVEVPPGKNLRLKAGTKFHLGSAAAEICACEPVQGPRGHADAGRNARGWFWGLALVTIAAGAAAGGWWWQKNFGLAKQIVFVHDQPVSKVVPKPDDQPPTDPFTKTVTKPDDAFAPNPVKKSAEPQEERKTEKRSKNVDLPALVRGYSGVYALQWAIDFDCLDGAEIDPVTGRLSLFGHSSKPGRILVIPYLDYLATALECESPSFSLNWTQESSPRMATAQTAGVQAIAEAMTKMFDENGLRSEASWFLRQQGIPVLAGMDDFEVGRWILEAGDQQKKAEIVSRVGLWLDKEGNDAAEWRSLAEALGLSEAYLDFEKKREEGAAEEALDQFLPQFLAALGRAICSTDKHYDQRYRRLRAEGKAHAAAMNAILADLQEEMSKLTHAALVQIVSRQGETPLPAEMIERLAGMGAPLVTPEFNNLPPTSLLAHVAFQADVAAKFLTDNPTLTYLVPGYRTQTAFRRARNEPLEHQGSERVWLAPGRFELTQSQDGRRVWITKSEMQINIRKTAGVGGEDLPDPSAEAYAGELTTHYDELAKVMPVLHVLREAEKVMALAKWVKRRGLAIRLPKEGRQQWAPPSEFPGVVHYAVSVDPTGMFVVSSSAAGGVDLDPEPDFRDAVGPMPPGSEGRIGVPGESSTLDSQERELQEAIQAAKAAGNKDEEYRLSHALSSIWYQKAIDLYRKGDKDGSEAFRRKAHNLCPANTIASKVLYEAWRHKPGEGPRLTLPAAESGSHGWSTPSFYWPAKQEPPVGSDEVASDPQNKTLREKFEKGRIPPYALKSKGVEMKQVQAKADALSKLFTISKSTGSPQAVTREQLLGQVLKTNPQLQREVDDYSENLAAFIKEYDELKKMAPADDREPPPEAKKLEQEFSDYTKQVKEKIAKENPELVTRGVIQME
jgi:hypothetical protein